MFVDQDMRNVCVVMFAACSAASTLPTLSSPPHQQQQQQSIGAWKLWVILLNALQGFANSLPISLKPRAKDIICIPSPPLAAANSILLGDNSIRDIAGANADYKTLLRCRAMGKSTYSIVHHREMAALSEQQEETIVKQLMQIVNDNHSDIASVERNTSNICHHRTYNDFINGTAAIDKLKLSLIRNKHSLASLASSTSE